MTTIEFKEHFLTQYDAATSLAGPGWEDDEISNFLNIAQDSIISELYKNKDYQRLAELVSINSNVATLTHPTIRNAMYANLTNVDSISSYLYYISSQTKLTRTNPTITDSWIPNELIDAATAPKFYLTTFNNVWFKYPKIFMETFDDEITDVYPKFIILVDAYTDIQPTIMELTYIRKPERIDLITGFNTSLNESLHPTIVKVAVEEALKAIKVTKVATQ